jgi:hypothetical protein
MDPVDRSVARGGRERSLDSFVGLSVDAEEGAKKTQKKEPKRRTNECGSGKAIIRCC